jgi:hypothetical protein
MPPSRSKSRHGRPLPHRSGRRRTPACRSAAWDPRARRCCSSGTAMPQARAPPGPKRPTPA